MDEEKVVATETTVTPEETIAAPEVEKKDSDASSEQEVDYRAELEAERARTAKLEEEKENYRRANIIKDRKLKKRLPEEDEFDDETEEEDPADAIAERVLQRIAPALTSSTLDQELARYTSNPDKQALIKFHYENSIARKGFDAQSIRDDVRKAAAIADAPRLRIERDEVARALDAKKTRPLGGSGHGTETEVTTKPYGWTPEQVKTINDRSIAATGKPMTDAELTRAWDLAKSGSAGAELPR